MSIDTPELDKMREVSETSQQIGEFLDWLMHVEGVNLMEWRSERDTWQVACPTGAPREYRHLLQAIDLRNQLSKDNPIKLPEHPKDCRCEGTGLVERSHTVEGFYPYPQGASIERLLAKYFEIDLVKVEKERQAVLDDFRERTGQT